MRLRWPFARWVIAHDRAAGQVAQRLVELVVEHVEGVEVRGLSRALLGDEVLLEPLEVLVGHAAGGGAHRGALERLADELRVGDRARGDGGDERAELRHDLDEAIVAQALQRLAHGRAADAERRGELVLGELAAGREVGPHDRVAQAGVDADPRGAAAALRQRDGLRRGHLHTCIPAAGRAVETDGRDPTPGGTPSLHARPGPRRQASSDRPRRDGGADRRRRRDLPRRSRPRLDRVAGGPADPTHRRPRQPRPAGSPARGRGRGPAACAGPRWAG